MLQVYIFENLIKFNKMQAQNWHLHSLTVVTNLQSHILAESVKNLKKNQKSAQCRYSTKFAQTFMNEIG